MKNSGTRPTSARTIVDSLVHSPFPFKGRISEEDSVSASSEDYYDEEAVSRAEQRENNPDVRNLKKLLPHGPYAFKVVDGSIMVTRPYPETSTNGAWEVQLTKDGDKWHILGDYMSDQTTAAVGINQVVNSLEDAAKLIMRGEKDAQGYAENERFVPDPTSEYNEYEDEAAERQQTDGSSEYTEHPE